MVNSKLCNTFAITALAGQKFQHHISRFLKQLVHSLALRLDHPQHGNVSAPRQKYPLVFIKEPVLGYHCNTNS